LLPAAIFGQAEVMLVGLMSAILAFAPWRGYGARGAVLPLISAAAACVAFAAPIGLNAADSAGLFADELRFGGGIAQPSGRISEVSQPSGDTPALEVIMDSPEALYLHGFTGCKYENGSWSAPHSDELAASQGELLALQKAGFTADSQPLRLLQSGGEDIRTQKVTVRRLGANGKYAYISDGADTVGSDYPAGLEIPADGDITEFTAVCDIFSAAESFPEAAAKADDGYLANAAALDGIYRGSYTQLPDTVERVLEARLGRHGGVDIAEASALVYRLLDGCEYDAAALPQTAESFLQETRAGNSCAYASAAVLAFRYLGVPARYAEGYALTKAQAESAAAGSAMTLTADDFHAWAEYYVEGAGWLPFEVVPEYLDKMPHSRLNTELSGGSRGASGSGAADEQSGGRVYNRLPDDEEETSVRSAMWIFPAAAAALLLIYLVYLLLRLELDPAYALAKCAARLGLSHDTAGRYDI
ncbi:MAG: transglutaminase domain-containing protein, partial [Ruminococcus sp.]|nr:transglutaminase domain-containing protein [Ruminococcus sp.]